MVCKLLISPYGLKEAPKSWNKNFDQANKTFDIDQNENETSVSKKMHESMMVFLVLYVDDILLIGM